MDFYRIRWQYEPKTFPIEWDENKNVISAFTPDFYLPDLDLYIELTTMKQSLVTKKNRKVRRLRELYPDVNIKILYERDYKNLIWKYGLAATKKKMATERVPLKIKRSRVTSSLCQPPCDGVLPVTCFLGVAVCSKTSRTGVRFV